MRTFGIIAVILLIAMFITSRFIAPPPPREIGFASGSPTGAYTLAAEAYALVFDDKDFTLNITTTTGSGDNLELLRSGEVQAAIIQGGTSRPTDQTEFLSLGSVFYEPLWVFYRADLAPEGMTAEDIRSLKGLRIAAGSENSGTRVLAEELLDINGISANLENTGGAEGAAQLQRGEIDALVSVSAPNAPFVRTLLADENIRVLSFKRALAYERLRPYLKRVVFPEGGLDLANNLPSAPIELVAPVAEIVVDKDLHPALQSLLLEAMSQTHSGGTLLSEPGVFPSPDRVALPLADEAERYYESGPSFLRRLFPFTMANFLERAWVLAIPLITLGIPLVRAAPPIYRWRTRRKIYIWYKDLRELERRGRSTRNPDLRQKIRNQLSALQAEVGRVEVPESYTDELYRLRAHISFVNQLLGNIDRQEEEPITSESAV